MVRITKPRKNGRSIAVNDFHHSQLGPDGNFLAIGTNVLDAHSKSSLLFSPFFRALVFFSDSLQNFFHFFPFLIGAEKGNVDAFTIPRWIILDTGHFNGGADFLPLITGQNDTIIFSFHFLPLLKGAGKWAGRVKF